MENNNTIESLHAVTIAPRNPARGVLTFVVTLTTFKDVRSYPCRSMESAIKLAERFIAGVTKPARPSTPEAETNPHQDEARRDAPPNKWPHRSVLPGFPVGDFFCSRTLPTHPQCSALPLTQGVFAGLRNPPNKMFCRGASKAGRRTCAGGVTVSFVSTSSAFSTRVVVQRIAPCTAQAR